jgi:hypothetical protein
MVSCCKSHDFMDMTELRRDQLLSSGPSRFHRLCAYHPSITSRFLENFGPKLSHSFPLKIIWNIWNYIYWNYLNMQTGGCDCAYGKLWPYRSFDPSENYGANAILPVPCKCLSGLFLWIYRKKVTGKINANPQHCPIPANIIGFTTPFSKKKFLLFFMNS